MFSTIVTVFADAGTAPLSATLAVDELTAAIDSETAVAVGVATTDENVVFVADAELFAGVACVVVVVVVVFFVTRPPNRAAIGDTVKSSIS